MTITILSDRPATTVLALVEGHNIELSTQPGSRCPTAPTPIYIRAFPGDRYEYVRSFTIGCDPSDPSNVWAYANASILSDSPTAKRTAVGCDLGDTIRVEGQDYRVDPASNRNIRLTAI